MVSQLGLLDREEQPKQLIITRIGLFHSFFFVSLGGYCLIGVYVSYCRRGLKYASL
jgi:hypothetical protein